MRSVIRCTCVAIAMALLVACSAAGGETAGSPATHRGLYMGASGGISGF